MTFSCRIMHASFSLYRRSHPGLKIVMKKCVDKNIIAAYWHAHRMLRAFILFQADNFTVMLSLSPPVGHYIASKYHFSLVKHYRADDRWLHDIIISMIRYRHIFDSSNVELLSPAERKCYHAAEEPPSPQRYCLLKAKRVFAYNNFYWKWSEINGHIHGCCLRSILIICHFACVNTCHSFIRINNAAQRAGRNCIQKINFIRQNAISWNAELR